MEQKQSWRHTQRSHHTIKPKETQNGIYEKLEKKVTAVTEQT